MARLISRASCAIDATGKEIVTIEGLSETGELHPLQQSFVEVGGLQCGFCTPGMIMTAQAILVERTLSLRGKRQEKDGGQPLSLHRVQESA